RTEQLPSKQSVTGSNPVQRAIFIYQARFCGLFITGKTLDSEMLNASQFRQLMIVWLTESC
ncbi:hypothetical protein, partial [Escherichia coli]|uniref:hypothetical protein n=1 Tax=Escherichia coli TaxID=562 RepID=UPI001BB47580